MFSSTSSEDQDSRQCLCSQLGIPYCSNFFTFFLLLACLAFFFEGAIRSNFSLEVAWMAVGVCGSLWEFVGGRINDWDMMDMSLLMSYMQVFIPVVFFPIEFSKKHVCSWIASVSWVLNSHFHCEFVSFLHWSQYGHWFLRQETFHLPSKSYILWRWWNSSDFFYDYAFCHPLDIKESCHFSAFNTFLNSVSAIFLSM